MLKERKFTVAAENLTKSIFIAIDSLIEAKLGIPPSTHEKRKEIVELSFKELSPFLKRAYSIHRRTYRNFIDCKDAEEMKHYAEELGRKADFIE